MSNRIVFSYAHPDDESFLSACLIRQLAESGDQPALLLATRGDAGGKNGAYAHLSKMDLGHLREKEMGRAAGVLKLDAVEFLGFPDGKLAECDEQAFLQGVVAFLNRRRPSGVFTFPPDGGNFHPDHMAISRITTKAVVGGQCPSVKQLYYTMSEPVMNAGHKPTFSVDTKPMWDVKAEALRAHDSQIIGIERYFGKLHDFPETKRYESFVIAWEQGVFWPEKSEDCAREELGLR
ncbi:PIG-L deacetylase family protein [Paenibacillus prosopidis]|uniref:LmbE family N-acetylglucosaminyl deacetylase n=1 Tax=Paenibacillus prosopidis TaxID=630520 RepID=A0A368W4L4_9BACL|nr:PIG-L family deacetylase [Paenibacillus prosopidis]RCW47806.1 LmbE family N-acetylglucosaminyl deacetylase [Paenibacillus prosopidis]